MNEALHFQIWGTVQGVGFRYTMQRQANALGLCGWVRNCADGSVEAVACGDPQALAELRLWATHGPRNAIVTTLEVSPWTGEISETHFEQKPTLHN